MKTGRLSNIINYLARLFDPKPFIKYTINSIKRNKWLIAIAFIFTVIPICQCIDLSWANPTRDLTFIGSMDDIAVSLSDTLGGYAETVYNLILPLGQSFAILYWLIQFGEIMMRSDLTPEHIALQFLKIGAFLTALSYGWDILTTLFDLFNEAFESVRTTLGDMDAITADLPISFDSLSDIEWYYSFAPIFELGIFALFKMFCQLVTSLIVWTRKLKLLLFAACTPIGVSDFIGGTRSASMRFIKKLIALGLQGVIMYVIAFLGNILIITAFTNMVIPGGAAGTPVDYVEALKEGSIHLFQFLIAAIPPALALLAAFNKSEEIANSVVGAH